jgi:G3E family GTPase
MKEINEIPVLLLTGYLGSGKTTLLNRILSNRKGIKFAVIVNDIGEVNIDADLIQQGGIVGQKDDSLVALQNGCICCTLKMDLVQQLSEITAMRKFDYIVIEASGICEPEPIAQTICSIPSMYPDMMKNGVAVMDCIVTVVDALRMQDEFACGNDLLGGHFEEEDIKSLVIQQIEFCNIVLLNKASEVKPEDLARIKEIVRALNSKAEILECDYCDVDLDRLVGTGMFDFDDVITSASWLGEIEKHENEDDDDDDEHNHEGEGHHHHHHHHDDEGEAEEYGIGTFVYYRREAFDMNKFDSFIAKHWPREIIRAKGLCYFTDEPDTCFIFEQAGKQVSLKDAGLWYATMPEDELRERMSWDKGLQRDWDPVYGDRMQKLVFIGQHLDKEAIIKGLDFCLEK